MSGTPGVEDPITAVFDLSDRAAEMAPTIRRMYRYTATVVVLFMAIMVFLLFVGLARDVFFAVLALVAIVFGALALSLLRETDRFYTSFVERHRAIRLLQDAEPAPKIPAGPTPVQRLARYLTLSNPKIASYLSTHPEALRYRARVRQGSGSIDFDLLLVAPGSWNGRRLGWGDPGFAVVARVGPDAPTPLDLDRFAEDVQRASRRIPARLARAILLRTNPIPLPDPVYDRAVGRPIDIDHRRIALEIVSEQKDGTYDLVPHVLGVP